MTLEEALQNVAKALEPESLNTLQIEVFRKTWHKQNYTEIAIELNHQYSYIKDIGANLWKLLSQKLKIKVTKRNLQAAVKQYVQQQLHVESASSQRLRVDWGEAVDVSQFCGRKPQLATLEQWVLQDRCRLVAIAGMGGIGKTMLVTQLTQQLVNTGQFEVVVFRSLRQALPLRDLLTELLSAIAPEQKIGARLDVTLRQLLKLLRERRCLLVLDNVEAVLSSNELVGTYRSGYEEYGWLLQQLAAGQYQSSILITTREIPPEVDIEAGASAPVRLLRLERLTSEEGAEILAAKGSIAAEQFQVQQLVERYQGNPLALKIVAAPLKELFDGNVAAFLAQDTLLFKDIRNLLAPQFARLSLLERQVMYWLAIDREPTTAAQLQADLLPSVSPASLQDALVSLTRRSLIERIIPTSAKAAAPLELDSVSYTQQPAVMEYVTEQLILQVCQEVEQAQIDCLRSYALLKVQATNDIKDVQMRLIVQPILTRLLDVLGGSENLKNLLLQLLQMQRLQAPLQPGYFAANTINLLRQLGVDLSHQDFSQLAIWQADLEMVNLLRTNFSNTNLSYSTFTQLINEILGFGFSLNAKYIVTWQGHNNATAWTLAFSFDGQTLASGSEDQTIKLWDVATRQCRRVLQGHTGTVQSSAFSPDGLVIVSGALNQSLRLWHTQTGQCLKIWQGYSKVVIGSAFHLDEKMLASCHGDKVLRLWNV